MFVDIKNSVQREKLENINYFLYIYLHCFIDGRKHGLLLNIFREIWENETQVLLQKLA